VFSQCQGKKEQFVLSCLASQRVGDFCMQCVRSLSGVALVSFLSFQPGVAMSKVVEQVQNPTQSTQTIAVDPFKIIEREQRRLDREQRKREREERIERQRQERERQRLERQQELEQRQQEMSSGDKSPIQAPSNSSPGNRQPRQAPVSAPVSPQEQEYMNSLTSEQRQLYEIIQRAKRVLQHQRVANVLGSGFGLSPRGTHQTAQDLDREFQNAIRTSNAANGVKPGNQLLQRILNKRSNETPEEWYARTSFLLRYTPGEEARLWRATLSPAQIQAYDALALKNRTDGMREVDGALKDAIRRELSCRNVRDSNGDYVRVCQE
jgi:TolA-binding protein